MRKVIHKWFWAWDFDKEEKWLSEMAAKGLALCAVGFCRYEFEECTPGEYSVRLEMLENKPNHPESQQYIRFIEDTGAEQVGSFQRWVYFRKRTADGSFDLHSDLDSRIRHLRRIMTLLLTLGLLNLYIGCYNLWLLFSLDSSVNALGFLNLAVFGLLLLGWSKLYKKKKAMEKEKLIYEG